MPRLAAIVAGLAGVFTLIPAFVTVLASADDDAPGPGPVLVELFTSQSCYSCPPAEALLAELAADRTDVVALEWHVTYWNDLVYGRAGRWEDPFSHPAHTERQRDYNQVLRGSRAVYTPQAVIDGTREVVGSSRADVTDAIDRMGRSRAKGDLTLTTDAEGLQIIANAPAHADVWLAAFTPHAVTDVPRGENHGKVLTNANIVRTLEHMGAVGEAGTLTATLEPAAMMEEGERCAIFVQGPNHGRVYAAAYCPSAPIG